MTETPPNLTDRLRRFRTAYGVARAREGRGGEAELLELPYVTHGPLAKEWSVRARSFDALDGRWLREREKRILDLGAGNGWLCYRTARSGHQPVAVDVRIDSVDGLAAAGGYRPHLKTLFPRVAASFEGLPFRTDSFDVGIFNASLHYALDLEAVLREVTRVVVAGGGIFIIDSPFYRSEEVGHQMVEEKRRSAGRQFGDLAEDLAGLPFIEFLTPRRLEEASSRLGLAWTRHRVWYPLWYELRPVVALLRRRRPPSRFDVWESVVP
jgi:SAM-dependent methyltransferase